MIAVALLPRALAAQTTPSSPSPVADALRATAQRYARILIAAAETSRATNTTTVPRRRK
jgi:hypothetical protein